MPTHQGYLDSFVAAVKSVLEEASLEDQPSVVIAFPHPEWRFFSLGMNFIYRRPETDAAVRLLLDKLFNNPRWRDKWSQSHIAGAFSKLSYQIDSDGDESIRAAVTALAAELDREAPECLVFFPVGGVSVTEAEVKLGPIRFFRMNDVERKRIRSITFAILATTKTTEADRTYYQNQTESLLQEYGELTVGEVLTAGDPAQAKLVADRLSEPVLDFLQLIAAIEEPRVKRIRVTAGGDLRARQPATLVIANDHSEFNWSQNLAFGHRLELNNKRVQRILDAGFGPVLVAIAKSDEQKSEFENLLLRAVHWIADADKQERIENQITSYTTSLELFFTAPGGMVVRDLTESVAYLLGKDLDHRREIKRLVSAYYTQRSKVSHGGALMATDGDVTELKVIAINVVAMMCRYSDRFKSKEDIQHFFADLRLSANLCERASG